MHGAAGKIIFQICVYRASTRDKEIIPMLEVTAILGGRERIFNFIQYKNVIINPIALAVLFI